MAEILTSAPLCASIMIGKGISEMKRPIDWEELRLFLAVARSAGLNAAARQTAASAPTLGRRMNALERRLDRQLFTRSQAGYELTEAGQVLYQYAQEMEAAARGIDRWRDETPRRLVRISAGSWTTRFLARHMDELWAGDAALAIELSTAHQRVDIQHRQADIGVRNRAPEEPRLAGRKTNDVAYALYRARGRSGDLPWVAVIGEASITPPARWVDRNFSRLAQITCSDPRAILDCVINGVGQAVLPCFVGDAEPELERAGGIIGEVHDEQWLVLNEQARHEPAVRGVIDRLAALLQRHRSLFAGEAGQT
jgi:DNA-binding transcriptional LysR family regulator